MSAYNISVSVDGIVVTKDGEVDEKFSVEVELDGNVQPVYLGTIKEPKYIVVIGDSEDIAFSATSATEGMIGAFPCGMTTDVLGTLTPAKFQMTEAGEGASACIWLIGTGKAIIVAGGDT